MRRSTRDTITLYTALLATLCASPARSADPAPDAAGPRSITLKNGARVLLAPDARAAAVSVSVWIEAGVRHERPGIIGISHLLEHLSARGIAPAGEREVRRRIEAMGGRSASFTTGDFTCFTHSVPRAALGEVLGLEAARFSVRPTQAMLDQDRAATREENRARARANPLERPLQQLYAVAFTAHPYRYPVLGRDEDLARITLKDCGDYLRARYSPEHVVITVVGDFDPEEALGLLRRHVEPITRRGAGRTAAVPGEAEAKGERRGSVVGELPVPVLVVGWRVPAGAPDEAAALDVISALLSAGSGARLTHRLVDQEKTCLLSRTGRDRQRDATLFWAAAAANPGGDSAQVERSLVDEVEKLAAEPVGGEELDRARRQLEVALLLGRQSAGDRGQVLGTAQMIAGDWRDADLQLERLRALTPADVQRAAARTFAAAQRTVVWVAAAAPGAPSIGGRP